MRKIRHRLTFANVVSCIALFVALGGAAYAAGRLGKNTVGTKQIKNGAVTGQKVATNTLTGANVEASTLGIVPNAQHAETASSSDSASNATNASELGGSGPSAFRDRCPAETTPAVEGLCMTPSSLPEASFNGALEACAAHGLRLPSPAEAILIGPKISTALAFWVDDYWINGKVEDALYFETPIESLHIQETSLLDDVYCVTTPSNA